MNETLRPLNGPPGLSDPVDPSLYADALYADLRRLHQEREWQPIATAPKDGTWILALQVGGVVHRVSWGRGRLGSEGWGSTVAFYGGGPWIAWMPCPPLPETEGKP